MPKCGRVLAYAGDDRVTGGFGVDRLLPVPGNDQANGLQDTDRQRGGPGHDRIRARGGEQDVVSCGPGFERAFLDALDVVEGASTTAPRRRLRGRAPGEPRPGEDATEQDPTSG